MHLTFDAPWSTPLTLICGLLAVILVGTYASGATIATVIVLVIMCLAAALAVRGYTVETDAVVVQRPGWETRLDLRDLEDVEVDPDAMRFALRTFGVGGPFAFVGRYRSGRIGGFTAYVTDRDRAVVLRWPDKTVVVTPDDPETFVAAVEAAAGL